MTLLGVSLMSTLSAVGFTPEPAMTLLGQGLMSDWTLCRRGSGRSRKGFDPASGEAGIMNVGDLLTVSDDHQGF